MNPIEQAVIDAALVLVRAQREAASFSMAHHPSSYEDFMVQNRMTNHLRTSEIDAQIALAKAVRHYQDYLAKPR